MSTALGVAVGSRAIGLVGDITMLHDVSALVDGFGEAHGSCALVVADNRGGGIFSFLAQRAAVDDARFERLFATPRAHDLVGIVVDVPTRDENVRLHDEWNENVKGILQGIQ